MKKSLFSILAFFAICQMQAQFFEGFEGATLPDPATGFWNLGSGTWHVSNNGVGTGQSWTINNGVATPPLQYQGVNAAYINRENIGQGNTSEDWLVTPLAAINPNSPLVKFFSRTTLLGDQGTIYKLMVSTSSQTDHSSFVTVDTWTENELNTAFNFYEEKVVDLSAYSGQQVYVAFVREFTQPTVAVDGDRWLLDAVSIGVGYVNLITGNVGLAADASDCSISSPLNAGLLFADDYGTITIWPVNGSYGITSQTQNVTVTPLANPAYFDINPPSYTYNFSGTGDTQTANFCIAPKPTPYHDLGVTIVPFNNVRPGFPAYYYVILQNQGNQPESGTAAFQFDDALFDYYSSSPGSTVTGNTIEWNFTGLQPLEKHSYFVHLQANAPTDTPPLNAGDVVTTSATATLTGVEETPSGNTFEFQQIASNSLDPNDKTVLEGESITPEQADGYLHYVVRFQNTGSAPAEFVKIRDFIDDDLDIGTIEVIAASHPVTTSVQNRLVEFGFDNINLPAESADEPNSHGYVAFRIKPASGWAIGTDFENTANIYFDYNFPITTNTVTTTVTVLGTSQFDLADNIRLYPNPAGGSVTIDLNDGIRVESISVFNLLGQLVKMIPPAFDGNSMTADISALNTGTYLISIVSDKGKTSKKLIKF